MGLPVDADTAGLDAPPPAAHDEHAEPCSETDDASDQSADDGFLADAELVGVKVLPLFPPAPPPMAFLCFFAVLAALLALCAVV
eukprot:5036427-Prymnesium_polylepis.1